MDGSAEPALRQQPTYQLTCSECIRLLAEVQPEVVKLRGRIENCDDPEELCYQHLKMICPAGRRARELEDNFPRWSAGYRAFRWLMDMTCGLLGLAAFVVSLPFVALAIVLQSPGPVIFRQKRVGRDGKLFEMLKFRTMHNRPDADTDALAEYQKDRIFPVGRILRAAHLDELPQVFNVFARNVSIVGPRPQLIPVAREMEQKLPHYRLRYKVPPGITGWAQVRYRDERTWHDSWVKLALELYYIKNASPAFDVKIVWLTAARVLRKMFGGRARPQAAKQEEAKQPVTQQ